MKKIYSFILIALLLVGCSTTPSSTTSLDAIKNKGELVVGYTNYPPLGYVDKDGSLTGLDVELAQMVGDALDVTVVFQYIDWDTKVFELNNRNIDVIWNGFTITKERQEEVNFSKPYMDNQIVILSRNDNPINTIQELESKRVAVESQSSGQIALEKHTISESISELQKYTNIADGLLALKGKVVDALVVDVTFAGYTQTLNPDTYTISLDKFDSEYYGIGFRKSDDDSLKHEIENIIDTLTTSGKTTELSLKWLGKDLFVKP